jgi:hypothetical protein
MQDGFSSSSFRSVSILHCSPYRNILTRLIVRLTGGALLVAAELVVPANTNLYIVAYVLQNAGVSLLMLATIGFLGLVYVA